MPSAMPPSVVISDTHAVFALRRKLRMSDAAYELHADIEQRDEQHEAQGHTVPTNPVDKIGYERAKAE